MYNLYDLGIDVFLIVQVVIGDTLIVYSIPLKINNDDRFSVKICKSR